MNKKALLCILITYCVTTIHCILDMIYTFKDLTYPHTIQHIVFQGAFLISVSLLIETLIFSLILVLRIKSYWKLFVPMILITGVVIGHHVANSYKPEQLQKVVVLPEQS